MNISYRPRARRGTILNDFYRISLNTQAAATKQQFYVRVKVIAFSPDVHMIEHYSPKKKS